ncbi:lysine N(6)-hydroxylase/L-ornithine N(5)-oxygenase family protein [Gordonia rhizosphera]|uniref:L-lysine N6-monooxygenase MbtG n=1 Tax=Gordonia rhizosphera NBRC 16068 TaxID=1108045 RepID=K6WJZ5_9ACTN|nr:SidA/IucD/PvdA family monooxygenase [Gordonia rhizosphera]GAB92482.1 putative L-ornithine N5-oxygenase [Gordonia rhizosphera NBRC 16068]
MSSSIRSNETTTTVRDAAGAGGSDIVDVLGVGYGPSNLALAIAVAEHNSESGEPPVRARFVERQEEFGWHPGMLLPRTTMQVSFLKDLVTQRNVQSRYSFLGYLAEVGRLTDFINHQTFFPTRREFDDYLRWAARTVDAHVVYGSSVVAIRDAGDHFEARTDGRSKGVARARNIVISTGLVPRMPEGVNPSPRVFHNHNLLGLLEDLPSTHQRRFAVLGAGQSAAETVEYLHSTYPDAEVHAVFAKYGFSPADDSPYANRIFDPGAIDDFYASTPEYRRRLLSYHRRTNYSAVDLPLIEELYAREYDERVAGRRRLFMHGASRAVRIEDRGCEALVRVANEPTGLTEDLHCDAVVCATGFEHMNVAPILGKLADDVVYEEDGPAVTRDYRLVTRRPTSGAIYLQGGTEHTHGISSSLLSNVAIRTGEIVRSVARDRNVMPGRR